MTDWTGEELDRGGRRAEELQISTAREDGSLRSWVPIWVVRVGRRPGRALRGADGAWYRHGIRLPRARITAGGVERDVTFTSASALVDAVDRAYRAEYGRYAGSYRDPMLADRATAITLRLVPRD